jgi:hypothetical protein
MAYGKGRNKGKDKRMADVGRSPTPPALARLRELYLDALEVFADAVWPASILEQPRSGKDNDALMMPVQASMKGTINNVYAEKARLAVKAAVSEQHRRGLKALFGKFKNIGAVGDFPVKDKDGREARRLLNLPETFSFTLPQADVDALQALAGSLDFKGTVALLRKVRAGKSNLQPAQAEALLALIASQQERFGRPQWDRDEGSVQVHLDYRCIAGGKDAWSKLLANATETLDVCRKLDTPIWISFTMSGPDARGEMVPIEPAFRPDIVKRLTKKAGDKPEVISFAVEIGPKETVVKAVVAQTTKVRALEDCKGLLGRDFGQVVTLAHSLVAIPEGGIDPARIDASESMRKLKGDDAKRAARKYLSSHVSGDEPILQVGHCGRDFLDRIQLHPDRIDKLKSEIDRFYNRLDRLRYEINRALQRPADAFVDLGLQTHDKKLARWIERFGKTLRVLARFKLMRRKVYRAVDGMKKSWFGWLSTQEAILAADHQAAVVREDLTYVTIPVDDPKYRGRTFNRLTNHGSRGQYTSRGSDKLKWRGIPELIVPSHYTSTTDHRFGVVSKRQRRDRVFKSAVDGLRADADLHASLTIALWLTLRPKTDNEGTTASIVTNASASIAGATRLGSSAVYGRE